MRLYALIYALSSVSLIFTISSMCAVLCWVLFRHDATSVVHVIRNGSKKKKKIIYKNNGTQNAYFVAIIAGIIPWTALFGYFAKMYTMNVYIGTERITNIPAIKIVFMIFSFAVIATIISIIFYNFIRRCGAESHCTKDIKFLRAHHMHINNH